MNRDDSPTVDTRKNVRVSVPSPLRKWRNSNPRDVVDVLVEDAGENIFVASVKVDSGNNVTIPAGAGAPKIRDIHPHIDEQANIVEIQYREWISNAREHVIEGRPLVDDEECGRRHLQLITGYELWAYESEVQVESHGDHVSVQIRNDSITKAHPEIFNISNRPNPQVLVSEKVFLDVFDLYGNTQATSPLAEEELHLHKGKWKIVCQDHGYFQGRGEIPLLTRFHGTVINEITSPNGEPNYRVGMRGSEFIRFVDIPNTELKHAIIREDVNGELQLAFSLPSNSIQDKHPEFADFPFTGQGSYRTQQEKATADFTTGEGLFSGSIVERREDPTHIEMWKQPWVKVQTKNGTTIWATGKSVEKAGEGKLKIQGEFLPRLPAARFFDGKSMPGGRQYLVEKSIVESVDNHFETILDARRYLRLTSRPWQHVLDDFNEKKPRITREIPLHDLFVEDFHQIQTGDYGLDKMRVELGEDTQVIFQGKDGDVEVNAPLRNGFNVDFRPNEFGLEGTEKILSASTWEKVYDGEKFIRKGVPGRVSIDQGDFVKLYVEDRRGNQDVVLTSIIIQPELPERRRVKLKELVGEKKIDDLNGNYADDWVKVNGVEKLEFLKPEEWQRPINPHEVSVLKLLEKYNTETVEKINFYKHDNPDYAILVKEHRDPDHGTRPLVVPKIVDISDTAELMGLHYGDGVKRNVEHTRPLRMNFSSPEQLAYYKIQLDKLFPEYRYNPDYSLICSLTRQERNSTLKMSQKGAELAFRWEDAIRQGWKGSDPTEFAIQQQHTSPGQVRLDFHPSPSTRDQTKAYSPDGSLTLNMRDSLSDIYFHSIFGKCCKYVQEGDMGVSKDFIKGVLDADGSVGKNSIHIASNLHEYELISKTLQNVGINHVIDEKKPRGEATTAEGVDIRIQRDVKKLLEETDCNLFNHFDKRRLMLEAQFKNQIPPEKRISPGLSPRFTEMQGQLEKKYMDEKIQIATAFFEAEKQRTGTTAFDNYLQNENKRAREGNAGTEENRHRRFNKFIENYAINQSVLDRRVEQIVAQRAEWANKSAMPDGAAATEVTAKIIHMDEHGVLVAPAPDYLACLPNARVKVPENATPGQVARIAFETPVVQRFPRLAEAIDTEYAGWQSERKIQQPEAIRLANAQPTLLKTRESAPMPATGTVIDVLGANPTQMQTKSDSRRYATGPIAAFGFLTAGNEVIEPGLQVLVAADSSSTALLGPEIQAFIEVLPQPFYAYNADAERSAFFHSTDKDVEVRELQVSGKRDRATDQQLLGVLDEGDPFHGRAFLAANAWQQGDTARVAAHVRSNLLVESAILQELHGRGQAGNLKSSTIELKLH